LAEDQNTYGHFMQDNAMDKVNNFMNAEDFGERVMSQGLWPASSPDLNPWRLLFMKHIRR
jgi:hypothetical protein